MIWTILLLGCGGPGVIQIQGSPEDAVEAVVDTLDAWKAGRKPDELRSDLSIIARDYQWESGAILHSFTIDGSARKDGSAWQVNAFLTFGAMGKPATYPIQAAYTVTLQPSITVFRMDHLE